MLIKMDDELPIWFGGEFFAGRSMVMLPTTCFLQINRQSKSRCFLRGCRVYTREIDA